MADFLISYRKTSEFEGGYSNHPNDKGGETYRGIARNSWSKWAGWKIIDRYKGSPHSSKEMTKVLSGSAELQDLVEAFYRANFWKPIWGDDIEDQRIADNIYDFAVNSGVGRAVQYAQHIVGAVEDSMMGPRTISAINTYDEDFVSEYKSERRGFFERIIARDESQEVFRNGWMNRVDNA